MFKVQKHHGLYRRRIPEFRIPEYLSIRPRRQRINDSGQFQKQNDPVHFEALDPSEIVLYAWKLSSDIHIYQNNKYPDGLRLTKFL